MNKDIGHALRMKRLRHGLSQEVVAEQAGISQQSLSRIERNTEVDPNIISKVKLTLDCITGKATGVKMLRRIAGIISYTPFPREDGQIFYWQAHVEDGGILVFTYGRNRVELWEGHLPEDEAAIQDGRALFRFELRVRFEDLNGKRASFCLRGYPEPEELRKFFRERDMGIATSLLNHLAEFISKWYTTPGIKKSE